MEVLILPMEIIWEIPTGITIRLRSPDLGYGNYGICAYLVRPSGDFNYVDNYVYNSYGLFSPSIDDIFTPTFAFWVNSYGYSGWYEQEVYDSYGNFALRIHIFTVVCITAHILLTKMAR